MTNNSDKKVLVVDDFEPMREIITEILNRMGYSSIHHAEDGVKALAFLEGNPDTYLVISDWNMPKMNGLDLLKNLRNTDQLKDIPFLMVTSEADSKCIVEAAQFGANQFLVKPFTAESMEQKLNSLFAQ